MELRRRYGLLFVIVLCAALPAIGAVLLYAITDDPTLRPLGITRERLAFEEGETNSISILVNVGLGQDRPPGPTEPELRRLIGGVLATHTNDFVIRFNEEPGEEVGVTFVVGPNRYGPYATNQMLEGVVPALIALDMTKRARE